MDAGLAALIAAAIATLGTLAGTWLNDYLARLRKDPSEQAAKTLLLTLLNQKWRWRTIDTLANVVGTDEATVRRLLLEIGARGSMRDGRLWGLTTRNPIANRDLLAEDPSIIEDPEPD
jgi:hypothetical protein